MDLLDACMAGVVLDGPAVPESIVVDFVLSVHGQSVVLEANWWTVDWDKDEHLYVFSGEFKPEPVPGDQEPRRWVVEDSSMNITGTSEEEQAVIGRSRMRIDLDHAGYFSQLDRLKGSLGEDYVPLLDDWRKRIGTREVLDAQKIVDQRNNQSRIVGRVFLNDGDGKVDVLVLDERGDAVVLNDDPWLTSFADDWMDRNEHPDVAGYIQWIMSRRPNSVLTLDGPVVESSTGSLISIAERAFGLTASPEK